MKTKQQENTQDHIAKGIAYGIAAFFTLAIMAAFVKLLGEKFTVIEIAFYRNLLPMLAFSGYFIAAGKARLFKSTKPKALFFRVVIGTFALLLTFGAMDALPLANATVLFFTSALLVPLLSVFFLNDTIGIHRIIATLIGFIGVVICIQPGGSGFAPIGIAMGLGAAIGHAIIQIFLRYLKSENAATITFYFLLGGTLIPALILPFLSPAMPILSDLPYILGVSITGGLAQLFLANAFRNAPASVISPFNYTGLIWTSGLDILIWHIIPGWPVFIGGAIIIGSGLYIIYREHKHAKRQA
ncbi:MAG: DMT family transporter [Alphaproteobacteria bacterium]